MTVSLVKKSRRRADCIEVVPIATNSFFEQWWLKGARELELTLVPTLWDPYFLNDDERLQLLHELESLRCWAAANPIGNQLSADDMVQRIDALSKSLEHDTCEDFTFCFG